MTWLLVLQVSWLAYLLFNKRWRASALLGGMWLASWLPVFSGLAFAQLWLGHFQAPSLLAAMLPWFRNRLAVKLVVVVLGALVYAGILGVHWIPVYAISYGEAGVGIMLAVAIIAIICHAWLVTFMALISMPLVATGTMMPTIWLDLWLWLWCALTLPIDLARRYFGRSTSKPA